MNATRQYPNLRNTLRIAILGALAIAPTLAVDSAYACAACGCTLSTDWDTQGNTTKPGFTADLSYSYLNQNQQRYGTSSASSALINKQLAAGQEVEAFTKTQTVTAALIYNEETWGVTTQVPFVNRTHGTYGNTAPLGSSYSTSSDTGIGDIKVIGRYSGYSETRTSGFIGGVKLPTGNTNANFTSGTAVAAGPNAPLDAGLQIGSGSTDVILGGYTSGTFDTYGWFAQGTVQHALAARNATGTNIKYIPGDAYSVNGGLRYAGFGAKISPMLQLNLIKRQADTGANGVVPLDPITNAPVSGGTLAYLAPGVSVRLGGGATAYTFVQLPIYQNVSSLQLTPKYTFTLGVRQSF